MIEVSQREIDIANDPDLTYTRVLLSNGEFCVVKPSPITDENGDIVSWNDAETGSTIYDDDVAFVFRPNEIVDDESLSEAFGKDYIVTR